MRGLLQWAAGGVNRPGQHSIMFKVEALRPVSVEAGISGGTMASLHLGIGNNFLATREIPEASLAEQAIQWVP